MASPTDPNAPGTATATTNGGSDGSSAAAAGALAAALDVAGDSDEDGTTRIEACALIQRMCGDAVFHALINSVPPAPPTSC